MASTSIRVGRVSSRRMVGSPVSMAMAMDITTVATRTAIITQVSRATVVAQSTRGRASSKTAVVMGMTVAAVVAVAGAEVSE
jgi:hypothetical protein